jgi:DmsE family decaheme c-type cytochrome
MRVPPASFSARALMATFVLAFISAIGVGSATADRVPSSQAVASSTQTAPRAPAPAAQAGDYVGDDTCTTCHEAEGKGLHATLHGKAQNERTPAASGRSCETCHGPGKAHVDSGDATRIKRFTAISPREASDTCLTCHNRGVHANWKGSPHDSRNMSCITCHSVHSPKSAKAQLKTMSEIDTCATCHKPQAMKVRRTQHMPITEGKMSCSSCHNPHGSTNVKQLKVGHWVNESCVSCHTEKRGPFLWEHAAGRESCVTCHDPHGSSNDRMLVAKPPMLCQRCHIGTRHPSTIYDGKNVQSVATASNRIYGRGCVNCHSNIHGSNHPSGNAFLR